jgi:hypothetical protein
VAGGGNAETWNLKFERGVDRQAEGEGVSREGAKVIIFQKFRPDPGLLDCGGLTPLWIFPSTRSIPIQSSVQPEHSKTPSLPQDVFGNCGTLSQLFRAFAASREIPDPDFLDCGGLTPLWIFPSTRSIPIQSSV